MGKRKEKDDENSEDRASPHKKAKHKHKKHKKKRERTSSNSEEIDVVGLDLKKENATGFGSLKLKIKFGGETMSTTQVLNVDKSKNPSQDILRGSSLQASTQLRQESSKGKTIEPDDLGENGDFEDDEDDEEIQDISVDNNEADLQQGVDSEDDIEDSDDENSRKTLEESVSDGRSQDIQLARGDEVDEETRWLDALEAGELDDMGRLKKEKDVSLMTTRQRALYGHMVEGENELLELPLWAKRRDEDSEEAQLRRKQRAKKRKQQMQKQIEETKAQTINKLLNKQAAKIKKEAKIKHKRRQGAHIKYINGRDSVSISLSKGIEFPLKAQGPRENPRAIRCAIDGCENIKKYCCSKTNLPVCGLSCYKRVQDLYIPSLVT